MLSQTIFRKLPFVPFAFFKGSPSRWLCVYSGGKPIKSGVGISGVLGTMTSTVVEVPMGTIACPFSQECNSLDRQLISLSGTAVFSVVDPKKFGETFDFSLSQRGQYQSEDPKRVGDRLSEILASAILTSSVKRTLTDLLGPQEDLGQEISSILVKNQALGKMGVSIDSVAITAIQPSPEIDKALESIRAEELKKEADAAIHARQLAAELKDRKLKQEALVTSKVVQDGERDILEAKFETSKRQAVLENEVQRLELVKADEQHKAQLKMVKEKVESDVVVSKIKSESIEEKAKNIAILGKAEGEALKQKADALQTFDAKKLQALSISGANPGTILATAFMDLAEKANQIGTLNITPDFLQSLVETKKR
jgi:hypothetical protein